MTDDTQQLITRIIRHYIRVHKAKKIGPDVIQQVWVRLLEDHIFLINEDIQNSGPARIQLWKTVHKLVRNEIKAIHSSNKRTVTNVEYLLDVEDEYASMLRVEMDLILDISDIAGIQEEEAGELLYGFLPGERVKQDEGTPPEIRSYINKTLLPIYNRVSDCPTLEEKSKNSQNNSADIRKSHIPAELRARKKYGKIHTQLCITQYRHLISPATIRKIITLFNDGYSVNQIYSYFRFSRKPPYQILKHPLATYWNIRCIISSLLHISDDLITAYQEPQISPVKSETMSLEELHRHLNERHIKCKMVYGRNKDYLLIHQFCRKCRRCDQIRAFKDQETDEIRWCCMQCRKHNRLHLLYKENYGNTLTGLMNFLMPENIQEYSVS